MSAFKGSASIIAVIFVSLITGCSTPKSEPVYMDLPDASTAPVVAQPEGQTTTPAVQASVEKAQPADSEKPELIVTPDDTLKGAVVSVNDPGRFVVVSFPLGRMPAVGSTLWAYRQGLKVAELTVTGPQKDDHTVADIRTGECRVNDEVRDR